nr:hypothetical protein [Polymorphobacter sp.]
MESFREICGYLLGLAFCLLALAMCWLAWLGLEDAFGWRWAIGGVAVSVMLRINFPILVGLYLYANGIMHWGIPESIAFAIPGFLLIIPSVAVDIFGVLVRTAARR